LQGEEWKRERREMEGEEKRREARRRRKGRNQPPKCFGLEPPLTIGCLL